MIASLSRAESSRPEKTDIATSPVRKLYARKRRYPRHPVEGRDIQAQMVFSEEVVLQNLSVSGACIRTIKDVEVGGRYLLRIQDKQPPLSLRGAVIWKREQETNEEMFRGYLAGLWFTSPTFEEIVRLKDFMRTYGEPDGRTVSDAHATGALRFSIRDGEKAMLNRHEVLDVKKISLCGMLVASGRRLQADGMYFMKIRLSPEAEPIKIRGRIASVISCSDRRRPGYDVGVEFLDLDVLDRARLDRFIHYL